MASDLESRLAPSSMALVGGLLAVTLVAPVSLAGDAGEASSGPLDLDRWQGQVVLVDFWASWCIPCRQSFPWMATMQDRYGDEGLVVVTVNVDTDREAADAFLGGVDYGFHALYDPEGRLAEAYELTAMPTSLLFDRSGRLAFRHAGFRTEELERYEGHITELLAATVEPEELPKEARRRRGRVRPWEKGELARADMRLDAEAIDLAFDDHIYFSKEASSGGRSFGGGGCGCN